MPSDAHGINHFPVRMLWADKNELSHPTLFRNDSYKLNQVLWSPDFELAVIVDSEAEGRPDNGNLFVLTTDNRPAIKLPLRGSNVRWGKK